ncbi:twitching motility protein PilT [candidate division KSB1 bacterium]|nr:twitching motility protein PilT [candidate division KSB1 bacterium]
MNALDENLLKDSKEILSSCKGKILPTHTGIEKQKYIGSEIIEKLSQKKRVVLKNLMNAILKRMRELDASDMDLGGLAARQMIWLRINGDKSPQPEFGKYEVEESNILVQSILMEGQREVLYDQSNLDFSYTFRLGKKIARHRADTYLDLDELALNMRAIGTDIRAYEGFGFHQSVTRIFNLAQTKEGLILITGITGSGKSSTMDAIIDLNNRSVAGHIIIIASPVEYVHLSDRCIVRHREVGRDTRSFKHGTIEALRQDPDIIVIGEMRDPDTILSGLEAADSGHKVFSTLHTSSAVESIDRIIGEISPVEQDRVRNRLADVLRCVISQKLVPTLEGKRTLAKEILVMTPSTKSAIKNNNTGEIYQMIGEGSKYGMRTMEQDLKRLYTEKKISVETAFNYANNKRRMKQILSTM